MFLDCFRYILSTGYLLPPSYLAICSSWTVLSPLCSSRCSSSWRRACCWRRSRSSGWWATSLPSSSSPGPQWGDPSPPSSLVSELLDFLRVRVFSRLPIWHMLRMLRLCSLHSSTRAKVGILSQQDCQGRQSQTAMILVSRDAIPRGPCSELGIHRVVYFCFLLY